MQNPGCAIITRVRPSSSGFHFKIQYPATPTQPWSEYSFPTKSLADLCRADWVSYYLDRHVCVMSRPLSLGGTRLGS
jgi:hypothetical protein